MILTKHHGLANDFLVALDEVNGIGLDLGPDAARRLCDRRTGVGADGLIHGARSSDPGIDVVMHLFNADGSRAEISGNGIRCLAQAVANARDEHQAVLHIGTDAGVKRAQIHENLDGRVATISVGMGVPGPGPEVPALVAQKLVGRFRTVDMGNPHLVIEVPDPEEVDVAAEGSWLESQFPQGVNVEFIAPSAAGGDAIALRVWERGAGITQACGSGACAAALAARDWEMVSGGSRVRVEMPGGTAEVDLDPPDPVESGELVLIGPAQLVATLEVGDV